jgi:hypothetical protein
MNIKTVLQIFLKARKISLSIFLIFMFMLSIFNTSIAQSDTTRNTQRLKWWQDAKFGLFLHWGLYSQAAGLWNGHRYKGNEHFMIYEKLSIKEYGSIANDFNPTKFDADQWVMYAKNAGMKYIVITTKHHDGFAMFNSPSNDYNIVKRTPWKRDPLKELAEACKKHDIKLGFYYSLGRDWQDPDVPTDWPTKGGRSNLVDYPNEDAKDLNKYIDRKVMPQIRELLTQYGPVAVLWFDTPQMFKKVFKNSNSKTTGLRNLLLDPGIAKLLQQKESSIQKVISVAALNSYPASGLMSALDYFNAYRRKLLPTNLVQAQRDFFGAHTYQRIDGEGIFHTKWEEKK